MKVQKQNPYNFTGIPTPKIKTAINGHLHLPAEEKVVKNASETKPRKSFNENYEDFINQMYLLERNIRKNPKDIKGHFILAGKALRASFRANLSFLMK